VTVGTLKLRKSKKKVEVIAIAIYLNGSRKTEVTRVTKVFANATVAEPH